MITVFDLDFAKDIGTRPNRILGWSKLNPKKDYEIGFKTIITNKTYPSIIVKEYVFDIEKEKDLYSKCYSIYGHTEAIWQLWALYKFFINMEKELGKDFTFDKISLLQVLVNNFTKDENLRIIKDENKFRYNYNYSTDGDVLNDSIFGYVGKNHWGKAISPNSFCIDIDYYNHNKNKRFIAKFYEINKNVKNDNPFLTLEKGIRPNYINKIITEEDLELYALFTYVDMMMQIADKFSRSFDIVDSEEDHFYNF